MNQTSPTIWRWFPAVKAWIDREIARRQAVIDRLDTPERRARIGRDIGMNQTSPATSRLARIAQERQDEEDLGVPHRERTPWFPPKGAKNGSEDTP